MFCNKLVGLPGDARDSVADLHHEQTVVTPLAGRDEHARAAASITCVGYTRNGTKVSIMLTMLVNPCTNTS